MNEETFKKVKVTLHSLQVVPSHDKLSKENISCKYLVNSTGPWAGKFAAKLGIHLPVEPRKRCIFVLDCPDGPKFDLAFLVDKCGLYVRCEGGCYVTGMAPNKVSQNPGEEGGMPKHPRADKNNSSRGNNYN